MVVPIAHYRKHVVLKNATALALLTLLLVVVTLFGLGRGNIFLLLADRPLMAPLAIVGLVGSGLGFVLTVATIHRIILNDGIALWIQNGRLVYLHRLFMSVACDDVSRLSIGVKESYGGPVILLETRDQRQKIIPTAALSEPAHVLLVRLKKALALT